MSIDLQTIIRNTCLYRGGEFMVLMAMADCANTADGDGIFPGIDLLAANSRQSVRQCQENIKRLRADGVVIQLGSDGQDLEPDVNATGGRGHRTEYRIDVERVQELQGLHEAEEGACDFCEAREKRAHKRVQFAQRKGEVSAPKGAVSDIKGEVSRFHIEEPSEPSVEPFLEPSVPRAIDEPVVQTVLEGFDAPKPSNVATLKPRSKPVDELQPSYDAFNEIAERAGWPKCQRRTPMRDAHLKRRLKEAGGLDGWIVALGKAEASDFLCGRAPPSDGRQPFFADIDFLLRESSFVKLMEGKYDNRDSPKGSGGVLDVAARVAAARAARAAH